MDSAPLAAQSMVSSAQIAVEEDLHPGVNPQSEAMSLQAPENIGREETMNLSIMTMSGKCYSVEAASIWSVRQVKDAITELTPDQTAYHQQRLLHGSRVLSDRDVLNKFLPHGQTDHEFLLVICTDEDKADLIAKLMTGCAKLEDADDKYKDDFDVVEAAVHKDGLSIKDARGAPRRDGSLIRAAIAQNGFALSYAPPEMRKDQNVVLEAVRTSSFAITYADEELQKDCEFVIAACKVNSFVRGYLDHSVMENERYRKATGLQPIKPACNSRQPQAAQAPPSVEKPNESFCLQRYCMSWLPRCCSKKKGKAELERLVEKPDSSKASKA